ncbi:MAG: DinB family protein [Gemmatimonadota bacterium]|nr:DinB family protein [Gemmatimonadota bacterium]
MHPRIQEVLSALDDTRKSLQGTIADIPPARLGVRPSDDRWSVAEIVEHLSMVEGRIAQMLTEKLDAARKAGLGHETDATPVAPMLDIATVIDRSNPITASEASQPRAGLSVEDGMKLLTERRLGLRNAVMSSDGLALGSVEIPHARLGTLNVYQWLLFLAGHEARHIDQIREVAASAPTPTPGTF